MIENGEFDAYQTTKRKQNLKHIFESHIFDDIPVENKNLLQAKHKTVQSVFVGNGDVFTWKGENLPQNEKKVQRRDPNQRIVDNRPQKQRVKTNKMFESSKENVLNTLA